MFSTIINIYLLHFINFYIWFLFEDILNEINQWIEKVLKTNLMDKNREISKIE